MPSNEKFDLIIRAEDLASSVIGEITGKIAGMVTVAAGIAGITKFLKDSVTAAIESEAAWSKLAASVERHGGAWMQSERTFRNFASQMQESLGESDEAVAESTARLVDYGMSGSEAMRTIRVAMDVAAARGTDLMTVTDAMARSFAGSTAMLQRLMGIAAESLNEDARHADLMHVAVERFGGAAAAAADTAAGHIRKTKQAWEEFTETVGTLTAPVGVSFLDEMSNRLVILTSRLSTFAEKMAALNFYIQPSKIEDIRTRLDIMKLGLLPAHGISGLPPGASEFTIWQESFRATAAKWRELTEDVDKKSRAAWDAQIEKMRAARQMLIDMRDVFNEIIARQGRISFRGGLPSDWYPENEVENIRRSIRNQRIAPWSEAEDQKPFRRDREAMDQLWKSEIDDLLLKEQKVNDDIQRQFQDTVAIVHSSLVDLSSGVVEMFLGMRSNLADIFRGMASDWIHFFLREIMRRTAISLGSKLFSVLFPHSAAAAAASGLMGEGDVVTIPGLGRISPMAGGINPSPASVSIHLNGDIIGDERFIRDRIIPQIERAASYGTTRIMVG